MANNFQNGPGGRLQREEENVSFGFMRPTISPLNQQQFMQVARGEMSPRQTGMNAPIVFGQKPGSIGEKIGQALTLGKKPYPGQGYSLTPSETAKQTAIDFATGEAIGAGVKAAAPYVRPLAKKTVDYIKNNRLFNKFKSEIDWGKWNSEIPANKSLMKEYNTIEQTTKANNTWMKNPDGSAFQGTPEQFVQQNSENFKKAFPEGHLSAYRGSQIFDPTLSKTLRGNVKDNILFGASDRATAEEYATNSGYNLDYLFKDLNKKPDFFHPDRSVPNTYTGSLEDVNPGMYQYALDKRLPTITAEGSSRNWANVKNDDVLQWMKINDPKSIDYRIKESLDPNLVRTDNLASYMIDKKIPIGVSKNTIDSYEGLPTDVILSNTKIARPKSLVFNNGMFDMTNPNIFKAIAPFAVGAGVLQKNKGK